MRLIHSGSRGVSRLPARFQHGVSQETLACLPGIDGRDILALFHYHIMVSRRVEAVIRRDLELLWPLFWGLVWSDWTLGCRVALWMVTR